MRKTKHTSEPWVARRQGSTIWIESDTNYLARGEPQPSEIMSCSSTLTNEPDAARIVDCVNACAGMADPAKEIAALRDDLAKLRNAVLVLNGSPDVVDSIVDKNNSLGDACNAAWAEMERQLPALAKVGGK